MKRTTLLTSAFVLLAASFGVSCANPDTRVAWPDTTSRCRAMPVDAPPGARVESVSVAANPGAMITFPAAPPLAPEPVTVPDVPATCAVTVTLSHPEANDRVTTKIELPQDPAQWNGRFQATGGSAYQAGDFGASLATAVRGGYAAAATDAGVGHSPVDVSGWALRADGSVDGALLADFAARSLHDMAVIGKQVTAAFYGRSPQYSYWNGCSTGGRQGYLEAQRYPADFQGILAAAPAVNWDRFAVATLWPQVVFNETHTRPSACTLKAFNTAAVQACDNLGGVQDGIIDVPQCCRWDPHQLVGTKVECEGAAHLITAAEADVVHRIWAGPVGADGRSLWFGPNKGADFTYLATPGTPFVVADQRVKYFVQRDPALDTTTLTSRAFARLFEDSRRTFGSVIGTDDPDLSAFAKAGGKLLSWHGQSDQLVPTGGTIDYRERVDRQLGGTGNVDEFYRLFLLPGVAHCGGGAGPQPSEAFGQLVQWVEHGQAPDTLTASTTRADGTVVSRNVCRFPEHARYNGTGNPNDAASYQCSA